MSSSSEAISEDSNIQITIPPESDHIPSQSHEQTPVAASPHLDGEGGVNEITPEDLSSLKRKVYVYALRDMWLEAQPIFQKNPDMLRIPLTANRDDTALHVAVSARSSTFVEGLVNLMNPEDLIIPRINRNVVNLEAAGNILQQSGYQEPHWLPMTGSHINIESMFLTYIEKNMFGPALQLLEKYPTELCLARDDPRNYRKALNMLARKPSVILNNKKGLQLLEQIYLGVREMEKDSKTESWTVLLSLVKSGNLEAVKCLIGNSSELLMTIKDPIDGRSPLHHAVLCRQPSIVSYLIELSTDYFNIPGSTSSDPKSRKDNLIIGGVDNKGNNVLHLAAQPESRSRDLYSFGLGSRANVKMRNDLAWFKEIEKKFHEFSYNAMVNDEGKTPKEIFYDKHKDLSEEIKKAAKGIADSGMIVGILVATVAFAAALTVPGDKTNAWFVVFIFTNAVALFASSASILSFLSNFTSLRFAPSQFVKTLHPSLIFGPVLLFIAIVAMVVAFTAASFLIFDHTSKWVSYAVASMGIFPILLLILFQFRFFDNHLWSRYYRLSNFE